VPPATLGPSADTAASIVKAFFRTTVLTRESRCEGNSRIRRCEVFFRRDKIFVIKVVRTVRSTGMRMEIMSERPGQVDARPVATVRAGVNGCADFSIRAPRLVFP